MTDVTASAFADALRDRYTLERELGRGGMATVYLAKDLRHARYVAVKVLRAELAAALSADRFLREIQLTASLQHAHILPLLDSGTAAGQCYYVMPYVEGESLRERLRREGQLPLEDALRLTREVADALDYAHQRNIIHRDIKPENILLSHGHALVADFGIALAASHLGGGRLTETGLSLGTPAYMSPEQAMAEPRLDGRSDQYSLACVLYELLAGEPPYTGPTAQAILAKRLSEPFPHLRTTRAVPPEVESAVTRALQKSAADRYPTAVQFAQALSDAAQTGTRKLMTEPRHLSQWISSVTLVLLMVLAAWWGMRKTGVAATARRGVALLPCDNTSPGPDSTYVGDRWSDELIQKLVRIGGLSAKSWESVQRYRNTPLPLRQIGAELEVSTLVRCRVVEQTTGVRLSAELIRAQDERVIWSNEYERSAGADGINAAQSAAARDIAQALGIVLPAGTLTAVERPLTRDSVALKLYRVGKHFLESFDDSASIRKSIDYFERAIARDSNLAQAHVGLAGAMIWHGERENLVSRDYLPKAAEHLRKSIALDPTIAEAHSALAGYLLAYTLDWVGAEEEHRRALTLNPNSVNAHLGYGWQLQIESRFREAIREFERAAELDPTNRMARDQLVRALDFAGDEERAMRELQEGLELTPDDRALYHHWAVMLLRRGQRDSAVAILSRHVPSPEWYDGWLYAAAGNRDRGQQILDSLLARNAVRPVDPLHVAAIQAGLGNAEEAFRWLDRAYADRSALLLFLLGPHPAFDGMRKDPRFLELRRKVGFKN